MSRIQAPQEYSFLMRLFLAFGLESIAWSLRRLHCPASHSDLVLEVGSGGNPYFRSNVLVDAHYETRQRHFVPLCSDRPTVLGYAENLPFKDKAFDFVIASHVLEHSSDPEAFLKELQRVAKAGYIEVPDAFFERLNPYFDHRLEITTKDDTLVIRKKASWQPDPDVALLFENRAKRLFTTNVYPKHPFQFHVRLFWKDTISFKVINPEVDASWPVVQPEHRSLEGQTMSIRTWIRTIVLKAARSVLSQKTRNSRLDLIPLLRCPTCLSDACLGKETDRLSCTKCGTVYELQANIPILQRKGKTA